jgi:hypothetical protein
MNKDDSRRLRRLKSISRELEFIEKLNKLIKERLIFCKDEMREINSQAGENK